MGAEWGHEARGWGGKKSGLRDCERAAADGVRLVACRVARHNGVVAVVTAIEIDANQRFVVSNCIAGRPRIRADHAETLEHAGDRGRAQRRATGPKKLT